MHTTITHQMRLTRTNTPYHQRTSSDRERAITARSDDNFYITHHRWRAMLSPPRLPALWVGFNAGARTRRRRASSGVTYTKLVNLAQAKTCTFCMQLILLLSDNANKRPQKLLSMLLVNQIRMC